MEALTSPKVDYKVISELTVYDEAGSVVKEFKDEPLLSGELLTLNLMCGQAAPLDRFKARIVDPNDGTSIVQEGVFHSTSNKSLAHQVVKKVLDRQITQSGAFGTSESDINLSKKYSVLSPSTALIAYEIVMINFNFKETVPVMIPSNDPGNSDGFKVYF